MSNHTSMSRTRQTNSTTEYALLGFLQDGPLHGYELHQRLQAAQTLGLVWRIKQAQLYALLGKLEADGLITAETLPQASRPPRRELRLTVAGRAAFSAWLETPVKHGRDLRIEFLAKLFWAQQAGLPAITTLIGAQREACRAWQAALEREIDQLASPYTELVARFRVGQIEAALNWLDQCEQLLIHEPAHS